MNQTSGVSFAALLGLLFIGLKLSNVITWDWTWVLAPFWIPVAAALLALVGFVVVMAIGDKSWRK